VVREVIDQGMVSDSSALVVQRWRRYGHDRAYVEVDGRPIGFRDLQTGQIRAEDPANVATIEDATAGLLDPADQDVVPDEAALPVTDPRFGRHGSDGDGETLDVNPGVLPYVPRHAAPDANTRHAFVRGFRKRTR
jgi:hypothetical protein